MFSDGLLGKGGRLKRQKAGIFDEMFRPSQILRPDIPCRLPIRQQLSRPFQTLPVSLRHTGFVHIPSAIFAFGMRRRTDDTLARQNGRIGYSSSGTQLRLHPAQIGAQTALYRLHDDLRAVVTVVGQNDFFHRRIMAARAFDDDADFRAAAEFALPDIFADDVFVLHAGGQFALQQSALRQSSPCQTYSLTMSSYCTQAASLRSNRARPIRSASSRPAAVVMMTTGLNAGIFRRPLI